MWPLVSVALAELNWTEPKSVSDSGEQLLVEPSHCDGASAIHSAVEVSGSAIVSVLENV